MRSDITQDDTGKRIVTSNGDEIGMITEVEGDKAFVDPDPGLTDTIRSKLGWGDAQEGDYVLDANRVEHVTEDEIRLEA